MPTASTAALICDTGALLDYLIENAPDHRLFRNAIDKARTRYIPALVLAEVDYFLRSKRQAMQTFMQDIARGAFTYVPPSLDQLSRDGDQSALRRSRSWSCGRFSCRARRGSRHPPSGNGDVRHFAAVRLPDGSSFDLVVVPTDPDRS